VSEPTASRARRLDVALALVLFAAVVLHERTLPLHLGSADESYFFHHSKRVLEGQAPYRDFWDLVTPASYYLMAAAFWLLGTTIETGRLVAAGIDGGIAVAMFAACRLLGVGRALAVAAPVAQIALFQIAWPYASPHWLSTLLGLGLFLGLVSPLVRGGAPSAALLGGISGLLVLVQQQRGAPLAVGIPALVLLDVLVTRALGATPPVDRWLAWFVRYVGAGALVTIPGFGFLIARAGFAPVWEALVQYPLQNYAAKYETRWGGMAYATAAYARETFPLVLRWLPSVLAVDVVRLAAAVWRRDVTVARRLVVLLGFSGLLATSISYYPDFIHIAFIAPVLLIAAAELAHAATSALGSPGVARLASSVVAAAVLLLGLVHGARIHASRAAAYPVVQQTAFGKVALQKPGHARVVERLRELAAAAGTDELYAYPTNVRFYLMTGLRNPTRYSLLEQGYNPQEDFDEVIRVLEAHQTPLVLVTVPFLEDDDPFVPWLKAHYTRLEEPETELATGLVVYARGKAAAGALDVPTTD
jgi:hypothetical protein